MKARVSANKRSGGAPSFSKEDVVLVHHSRVENNLECFIDSFSRLTARFDEDSVVLALKRLHLLLSHEVRTRLHVNLRGHQDDLGRWVGVFQLRYPNTCNLVIRVAVVHCEAEHEAVRLVVGDLSHIAQPGVACRVTHCHFDVLCF